MTLLNLTAYKPVPETLEDADQIADGFTAIETVVNGGIGADNFASGKIFDPYKILQKSATDGESLTWNDSAARWEPGPGIASLGYVNVKDHGAKGDGTTDDSAAFTAAIAEVVANGAGTLLLPAGANQTYKLGSTVTLPAGVNVLGGGTKRGAYSGGVTVTGAITPLFAFSTTEFTGKCVIENCLFKSTASGTDAAIFYLPFDGSFGISFLKVENCYFDMTGSAATNRRAFYFSFTAQGTVEQCYWAECDFKGCDSAVAAFGRLTGAAIGDFDKCVFEKCRFDSCRGSASAPGQLDFDIRIMRSGGVRDCAFFGVVDGARAAIRVKAEALAYWLDDVYCEDMASAATATYDEIVFLRSEGASGGDGYPHALSFKALDLGDHNGTNVSRYGVNLEEMGGCFLDDVEVPGAHFVACSSGKPVRLSRVYGTPANSASFDACVLHTS